LFNSGGDVIGGASFQHHNYEEDPASIPPTKPAHAPAIQTIPDRHFPSQPKELGLNLHFVGPDTSMALRLGTVNTSESLPHRQEDSA